jgi:glucokinase
MGTCGTARELSERAKAGDEAALAVYRESARRLGAGLSVLIDLFNPERIVIGSVFARSEVLFREEMEKVIAREALAEAAAVCAVVPAALGDAIGDYAAVAVAQRGLEAQHV